ncbi:hypothetical protein HY009_03340 [Candidatus Acetothermia bacterium]|nr:hypothetical protein [Candidatus Acetothermia bacterium]
MPDHNSQLPWTQPSWLEEAHYWIHTQLERQGIRVNGLIEQPHVRPWSTVLRVPTTEGNIYFKATMPALHTSRRLPKHWRDGDQTVCCRCWQSIRSTSGC